jgi:hypothetical protein
VPLQALSQQTPSTHASPLPHGVGEPVHDAPLARPATHHPIALQ